MSNDVTDTNVGKMTEQDAIHEIELMEQMECACPDCERRRPALQMAIEALQKQLPMTPNGDKCQSCNADVRNWTGDEPFNWCPDCGQRILWRDEE